MKISELVVLLQEAQRKFGDVELRTRQGDGHSSWISVFKPKVVLHQPWPAKEPIYELVQDGY